MSKDNRGDGKKKGGKEKEKCIRGNFSLGQNTYHKKYCQVPSQINIKKLIMKIDLPHFL